MTFCSRFWGYIRGAAYETFSVCVHMSRNVVVSFAEGHRDNLDDKKNMGLYDFLQPIWGAIHIRDLFLCVHMSRNVVVSLADGYMYSDDLDDKKIWAI